MVLEAFGAISETCCNVCPNAATVELAALSCEAGELAALLPIKSEPMSVAPTTTTTTTVTIMSAFRFGMLVKEYTSEIRFG